MTAWPCVLLRVTLRLRQIVACNNKHSNSLNIHTNCLVRFDNPDNFT
jgi:hypothetical protein